MATTANVETRETASMIGSDKVEGTAVYGADEQKMLDRAGTPRAVLAGRGSRGDRLTCWAPEGRGCGGAPGRNRGWRLRVCVWNQCRGFRRQCECQRRWGHRDR